MPHSLTTLKGASTINSDSPPHPAFLDGETHVRWKLEWRYTLSEDATEDFGSEEIDIEEDRCIGLEPGEPDVSLYDELNPHEAELLWEPLPLDIPTMKKYLLLQMAALKAMWTGFLDASAADRRRISPVTRSKPSALSVVYTITQCRITDNERAETQTAINARRIMINDVGTFTEDDHCKPRLIWYALKPDESTLRSLAKWCPFMHTQIAIAAIYCNYQGLYETLNIRPSMGPMLAAEKSPIPSKRLT
ncbi:uncharacterized protein BDW70DRAFT_160359 [Aspergillus foveolatus]|uniref:uncharacterized protein n=1 Tax=Aspergillus foveolatus TaxID=210207 RepID=UPI003CCD0C5F